ncbi:hypothetical protein [Mesorhizobium sp. LNHC229A00]|nr:hypothetical protein [Mesorhizobium sp. LNHC229A00]
MIKHGINSTQTGAITESSGTVSRQSGLHHLEHLPLFLSRQEPEFEAILG